MANCSDCSDCKFAKKYDVCLFRRQTLKKCYESEEEVFEGEFYDQSCKSYNGTKHIKIFNSGKLKVVSCKNKENNNVLSCADCPIYLAKLLIKDIEEES